MDYGREIYSEPLTTSFDERLLTYRNWPRKLSPTVLARAGFFYTGEADIVKCFYCRSEWNNWGPMDDPLTDHLRDSPNCVFAVLQKQHIIEERRIFIKNVKFLIEEAKLQSRNKEIEHFITMPYKLIFYSTILMFLPVIISILNCNNVLK